ncbi:MAG: phosphate/phosphite/phosphonate ABC transporter substrate-binding protein [Syntrophobacteraceae bacterium]|nr:phosphate/phosphite/phosphonate ABC transporter substrate-binding protein [Syntrophobacteraceae bacterium]
MGQRGRVPPRLRAFIFLLLVVCVFAGCGKENNSRVVDFTKTIPVARPSERTTGQPPLKVAVGAMVSPKETFVYYRQLLDYLGNKLGRHIELVQRKTYEEVNELICKGGIDLAFVCSGPYVAGKGKCGFDLLATPEMHGSHFYYSYLIVNKNSPFRGLADLKGRVFAFSDPDSLTGKLVPTYWLAEMHERPQTFFRKVIFTYSHDNSILAVAKGLVDGAAVDGLVWEYYHHAEPALVSATRVVCKWGPYGIPPLVASSTTPPALRDRVRKILLTMREDPEGRQILEKLLIDRFTAPNEAWYDSVRELERSVSAVK